MKILRTPDSCFENLPDYDFEPHYAVIRDEDGTELRIHYIDEGPKDAEPILLMHGNPTWVYLYRHMVKGLLKTGRRVIAVDLVGCGRSDKPSKRKDYTLARHHDWTAKWIEAMDLNKITLFCQDWGGTIGLAMVARFPDRFDRVIVSNSGVPIGDGGNKLLRNWQRIMKIIPGFPWNMAARKAFRGRVTDAEFAAYKAPFPSRKYEAGILKFPQLITVFSDNPELHLNLEVWFKLAAFDKPLLTLFGDKDPVAGNMQKPLVDHIPGARGQKHRTLTNVGHFCQQEVPDELVESIVSFLEVS